MMGTPPASISISPRTVRAKRSLPVLSAAKHNAKYVLNPEHLWIAKGDKTAWYPALYRHQDFRDLVAELWETRAKGAVEALLGISEMEGIRSIDQWQKAIQDSVEMDRKRWPRPSSSDTVAQTGSSFEANINYLKDFLTKRYHFLNKTWVSGK